MKGSLTACEAMPREQPQAGAQLLPGYHSSAPSPLTARCGDQGHTVSATASLDTSSGALLHVPHTLTPTLLFLEEK